MRAACSMSWTLSPAGSDRCAHRLSGPVRYPRRHAGRAGYRLRFASTVIDERLSPSDIGRLYWDTQNRLHYVPDTAENVAASAAGTQTESSIPVNLDDAGKDEENPSGAEDGRPMRIPEQKRNTRTKHTSRTTMDRMMNMRMKPASGRTKRGMKPSNSA